MSDPFRTHIRQALADPNLQSALDTNAERRRIARQQAYTSLPEDLQALRRRAHTLRAEVITNLEAYLEQFTQRAQANGLIVHRAADAAQAVQIVLEIAQEHGARRVAKSKTMIGEEIHLNQGLEAAGLEVVETDLGEYIVQLRGERPSHILTPAVHLRRADVARTFQEKLGIPYTEDVADLTAAARKVLRRAFIEADLGISGVNFGVVENGALCLLTNEGNGRMVTTLPRVHVALMGIERMAPTLDDLALLLYLLPRSGTGQKLTVYTSLIRSPRHPGEPDGASERHLVLLDNGRSAIRRSPLAEALYCIRCGACLNACPVFQEIGGHAYVSIHGEGSPYPGPIGSVLAPALFGQSEFGNLARATSLCGACKEACPVDIDLPSLLLKVRAGGLQIGVGDAAGKASDQLPAPQHVPAALKVALRFFTWVAVHPQRFALAQRLAGLSARLAAPASGWLRLPAITGWGYSRDFPRPAVRPFRLRWGSGRPIQPARLVQQPTANVPLARAAASPAGSGSQPLSARFASELAALGGAVTFCQEADLAGRVLALLEEHGISSIQAWDGETLPVGLLHALQSGGIRVAQEPDPNVRAGLTGASAGIAESGTLTLAGGPGRPLTASLLPEIHLAVLRAEDIYENLPTVLKRQEVREAGYVTLISGPSRTADIEMTLTIGVHGPKEVHVFCVTASGPPADHDRGDDDHDDDDHNRQRQAEERR
ncbi:MAG TPA: LUD domain-containing protein [Anaerolineales bacterium]